jgi:4-amino-4-deoxy-L-arabinose transferase-like glycosyltransferase
MPAFVWGLALLPAALAVAQLGRIHPDEVYQALEPAWVRVHGYGVVAWEWREGLRNWAFPLVLAGLLKVCAALGVEHPVAARAALGLPLLLLHAAALRAVLRLARRRVEEGAARGAVLLVGLYAPVLLYAGRTLGEATSTAFALLAVDWLDAGAREERAARGAGLLGGAALGLAVVARYPSAVLVLAALGYLAASRRRWPLLAWTCAGGAGVAAALAALDLATWGRPLHSLLAYVQFNLLSGGAERQFGAEGPAFYAAPLLRALPLWLLAPLALRVRPRTADGGAAGGGGEEGEGRAARPGEGVGLAALLAGLYLAVLLATPHKEERFLYPAWVLLAVAGAPAAAAWVVRRPSRGGRGLAGAAALAASLLPLAFAPEVRGDQFRALVRAARPPATGLLIVNEGLWGAGGSFYVGRPIPWVTCDWPHEPAFQQAVADPRFNRAITFEGRALPALEAAGFRVVGQEGRETLLAR